MLERLAFGLWESIVFPFREYAAARERKERRRETFRARGLCSHCGEEPPLENEDECYPCAERRSL